MLRVKKIELSEKYQDGGEYFDFDSIQLQNINLIIGPNASGKSQFFARLKFLRAIHTKRIPTPSLITIFHAKVVFEDKEIKEEINYELRAGPGEFIEETISSGSKEFLGINGNDLFLLNEKEGREVSFLVNKRQSVTKQIEDHKDVFPTIYKIGNFFENILFLEADKFDPNALAIGPNQLIPSDRMENISSVILNWQKQCLNIYELLLKEYKRFFPYIERFLSERVQVPHGRVEILALKEKNIRKSVLAPEMSSGMLRILCLLALPMSRHLGQSIPNFKPSMIIIDEIDNGLDYKCTGDIIEYLEGETDFFQIIFSSHSPIVCNFISPEKWHIFKRRASKVKVTNPSKVRETKELIEQAKASNWEIYKNHIANSSLYSVE